MPRSRGRGRLLRAEREAPPPRARGRGARLARARRRRLGRGAGPARARRRRLGRGPGAGRRRPGRRLEPAAEDLGDGAAAAIVVVQPVPRRIEALERACGRRGGDLAAQRAPDLLEQPPAEESRQRLLDREVEAEAEGAREERLAARAERRGRERRGRRGRDRIRDDQLSGRVRGRGG